MTSPVVILYIPCTMIRSLLVVIELAIDRISILALIFPSCVSRHVIFPLSLRS